MQKLYDGLKSSGDITQNKIAVFKFIIFFTRVLDGVSTVQDLVKEFNLTGDQVAELQVYLTKVGEKITASVSERLAALGKNDATSVKIATEDARAFWFSRVWHTLCGVEYGYVSLDEVKSIFGIQ